MGSAVEGALGHSAYQCLSRDAVTYCAQTVPMKKGLKTGKAQAAKSGQAVPQLSGTLLETVTPGRGCQLGNQTTPQ